MALESGFSVTPAIWVRRQLPHHFPVFHHWASRLARHDRGIKVDDRPAAAAEKSLSFLFWGAVIVLPVIAIYTAAVYWVFRGKLHQA